MMDQEKNFPNELSGVSEKNEANNASSASNASSQEIPTVMNASTSETKASEPVNNTQEPTSNFQESANNPREQVSVVNTSTETPKKKGLWSRILHSKDSTKLVGALAFCAVFATCTLLAVTVFDKPGHLGDKAADFHMEQRADSDEKSTNDMRDDRFNRGSDLDRRGNGPSGNSIAPNEAKPNDESNSNNENAQNNDNAQNNEDKPDDAGTTNNNGNFGKDRPGDLPDTQNAPDDSEKNDSSSKSTTTNLA